MKIILERYYGDWRVTKSVMRVVENVETQRDGSLAGGALEDGSSQRLLLECEAREPKFAQYVKAFPGCSKCCLACGTFACKVVSTELSPMTVSVVKSPGHHGCRIGWDYLAQVRANMVLVGESDGYENPEFRDIIRSKETFERLEKLVYAAYAEGERIEMEVRNRVEYMVNC